MKEKNPQQIIRFDGKNVFMEVMNSAFTIGKVQINFIEYDVKAEKNNRQKKNIPLYIDIDKFLVLANDIITGRMTQLGKLSKDAQQKGGHKYAKEIFADLGGISAKVLEKRGKSRPDGKSLSRQFKITPGDKIPWIISGEVGAGEENDTGLIVPKGYPEEAVRVPLSDEDFKKFAIVVKAHIEAYLASQYGNKELQELKTQFETLKPIFNALTQYLRRENIPVVFPKPPQEQNNNK